MQSECMRMALQGWRWLEDDWFIDMGGLNTSAIDNDGWSYAVDFSWLHNPPVPGAGRFKRVGITFSRPSSS